MKIKRCTAFLGIAVIGFNLNATNPQKPIYLDSSAPIESRIDDAIKRLTMEEKVALCHAQSKFSSAGVPRLGIPELWCSDGPHGVREELLWDSWKPAKWTNDSSLAFPALTCLAAAWNPRLAYQYGKALGEQARYRKKNVILGPGVNIYRTPLNGRNFEYMGEDPYLTSKMAVPYIKGVQSNGVAACVKHFAVNNQEYHRHTVDVHVSERALNEIYLPAFKAAVQEGGTWAVMPAYNLFRGRHCCQNNILLDSILRNEWHFNGATISDWGGVHDTFEAATASIDLEMGPHTDGLANGKASADRYTSLAEPYLQAMKAGKIDTATVNKKVRNILRLMMRTNMNTKDSGWGKLLSEDQIEVARRIAEEGIVLLKNEKHLFPVGKDVKKILVIGENANRTMIYPGGSSKIKARYETLPLEALKKRFGNDRITYLKGYTSNAEEQPSSKKELIEAAKDADLVIFFGGLNKEKKQDSEGDDRESYTLPYGQDSIIATLADSNKRTAVILLSGNAVEMPWISKVSTIMEGWYSGSEAGNALAAVIAGDVNPSGKLPFTWYRQLGDCGAHAFDKTAYPGIDDYEEYKEDIFVGYRWTEKHQIQPLFPFGHGLSYTEFRYSDFAASATTITDSIKISVKIANTGKLKGKETVQLYIQDKTSSLPRPIKELKGFHKVELNPGETKTVEFIIQKNDLAFYNPNVKKWVAEPGDFVAQIGTSSTNIKGKINFSLKVF